MVKVEMYQVSVPRIEKEKKNYKIHSIKYLIR